MTSKIKMISLEIPKSLSVHKIPSIKKKILNFSTEALEIMYYIVEDDVDDISEEKLIEYVSEDDLFNLDEDSKNSMRRAFTIKSLLINSIDDIVSPIIAGKDRSKNGRVLKNNFGSSSYMVSFHDEWAYAPKDDFLMLYLLKYSGALK